MNFFYGYLVGVLITGVILGIIHTHDIQNTKQESAMSVYRGETALKYEVVNDIKVDSCVIWKNKEE